MKQWAIIDSTYKVIMKSFIATPQVYKIHYRENFMAQLKKMNQDSETVKDGLSIWLGLLRDSFARLYFISNEEMIDIFGKSAEIVDKMIAGKQQAFLHSLFEGIDKLEVSSESRRIQGMYSKMGEYIPFRATVATNNATPERWLMGLELAMQMSLKF